MQSRAAGAPPRDPGTDLTAGSAPYDPLVFNLRKVRIELSGLDDPVSFDIDADGRRETISWTARNAGAAFLALDRNGNGMIDDGGEPVR